MIFSDFRGRKVRLSHERWEHINNRHPETKNQINIIEETITRPDLVQKGNGDELLAIRKFKKTPVSNDKFCVVVYKLKGIDAFMITSYFTRRPSYRRRLIWRKH